MEKTVRTEGKTTTEAIEKGLKELGVSKDKVEVKILEEEKRSFYSILSPRVVKVELTLKEDNQEKLVKNEKVKEEAKENNSEQLEVNIAKHRNGETTKFYLAFEANTNACMNYANVSE